MEMQSLLVMEQVFRLLRHKSILGREQMWALVLSGQTSVGRWDLLSLVLYVLRGVHILVT